jgi:NDP-sugar pyrophosphorylase family protein
LLLGHGADRILDEVQSRPVAGLGIEWLVESEPLGNGGALLAERVTVVPHRPGVGGAIGYGYG